VNEPAPGSAPVIGISAYHEQARWRQWDLPAVLLPRRYVDQVTAVGAVPVLLPPVPGVQACIPRLDGLLISGGPDVDPVHYGQEPGPYTTADPARDEAELALVAEALARRLPLLGICRGMQVMNVVAGGTLIQHLPDAVGHDGHRPIPGAFGTHQVRLRAGSRLAALAGPEEGGEGPVAVPTHHHQGIGRLGEGLAAVGWAEDGTVEAVEISEDRHPFAVGVQWHPEASDDPRLVAALAEAAGSAGRAARSPRPAPAVRPLHSPA
jgi:putative glutamine amidotransferase